MICTIFYNVHNGELTNFFDKQISISAYDRSRGIGALYIDSEKVPQGPFFVRDGKLIPKGIHSKEPLPKDPENILVNRNSFGLGDVVTTLALVQDLREKYKSSKIVYYIRETYREILERHPAIDLVIIKPQNFNNCHVIELSHPCPASLYESNTVPYTDKSRIELWKDSVGMASDTKPKLYLSSQEIEWGKEYVGTNKVGLVLRTSEKWRDYPSNKKLLENLKGLGVILIDHKINPFEVKSTNDLTIRQHMAVINALKVIITPDTAWLHVAGALNKKIVALMGSMDPEYRSNPYNAISLTAECPYDRHPCWYDICVEKREVPPCMNINIDKIVNATQLLAG